jgi:hypothetical protein
MSLMSLTGRGGVKRCLKVEQEHPGTGAIRNSQELNFGAVFQTARFHEQSDPMPFLFPWLVVGPRLPVDWDTL